MKIDLTITRQKKGLNIVGKNDERVKLDIPTTWPQVTFKQYMGLLKCKGDIIKIVSLFSELDEELIRKAKIHNLAVVTACLNFLSTPPIYLTPTSILGYKVADNLDTESIAQYADLQEIAGKLKEDDPEHNFSLFPSMVATYAVSPYDFKEAEKIQDQFLYAPCTEVLAIGNFTLVRLHALKTGIVPTSPLRATRWNKLKLALINWLQTLDSTVRYFLWKRSLPLNERKYLNGR